MNRFRYILVSKTKLEAVPGLRPDVVMSGNIEYVAYSIELKELRVVFSSGEYKYIGVPQHAFIGLLTAESPGKFFQTNIKPTYSCEKVDQARVAL